MVYLRLRQDGWFETGKRIARVRPIYEAKQTLFDALVSIGEQPSIQELERQLQTVPIVHGFEDNPYIEEDQLYINTPGMPGKVFLGFVRESSARSPR